MDTHVRYLLEKIAGIRGAMNILPPKSLGDKGIQSVLKDLSKRKKISKQPIPGPDELLDRAAGYLADKGMLRKKSEEKQARCWSGFEPVPGKEPYSKGSCRPKTQTTKRVNEKVGNLMSGAVPKGGMADALGMGKGGKAGIGGLKPGGIGEGINSGNGSYKRPMGGGGGLNPGALQMSMSTGRKVMGSSSRRGIGGGIKAGEQIPLEELTTALNKLASLKKKTKIKGEDGAPTLDDINEYFVDLRKLLQSNAVSSKKYKKPESVKDVPLASTYREVINAAKKEDIGMVRRHLLAMFTRPSVWRGDNASFYPRGEHGLVVAPKKVHKDVLDHEFGHAEDYRRLGGQEGFKKEYHPGFFERLSMPQREYFNRSVLLPEARAWHYANNPVDLSEKNQLKNRAFGSYVSFVENMLAGGGLHKGAAATTTIYYASPNRQLVRIPKDAVVSLDPDIAYQMGRFYPETKQTWNPKDLSGKWTGGTAQPTFKAGRMPMGRPTLYRAEVSQADLAVISDMAKSVKKLRRGVNATIVKQTNEKE